MRTFGVIFAVLSLGLSASAAAIFGRGGVDANIVVTTGETAVKARGFDVVDVLSSSTGQIHRREATGAIEAVSQRDGEDSFPAIVARVTVQVEALAAKLDVAVKADIEVDAVVKILGDIGDVLLTAVGDIKVLIAANVEGILTLDGKLLAVADIAVLIAALIQLCVVKAIVVVLNIKVLADVDLIIKACVNISVQVGAIINLGVGLVPGLVVGVVALIGGIIADIHLSVCADIALALGI